MRGKDTPECAHGRGWGPFTSRQLTTIICVAIVAVVMVPTAALAAIGTFDSSTGAPAVMGTNSSTSVGTKAVEGKQTGGGHNTRYGVLGTANGPGGVGVIGTGTRDGVYSNGPLTVRAGSTLRCSGCVSLSDLSHTARSERPLSRGQSESGAFGAGGGNTTGGYIGEGITYPRVLPAAIKNNHIVDARKWPVPHCAAPGKADRGYLCLYEAVINDVGAGYGFSTALANAQSVGVILFWPGGGPGTPYVGGVWTVTAS